MNATERVLALVQQERDFQDRRWGRAPGQWPGGDAIRLAALVEEVGEVARAICDAESRERLRAGLVQVAAVAVAWAETLMEEP